MGKGPCFTAINPAPRTKSRSRLSEWLDNSLGPWSVWVSFLYHCVSCHRLYCSGEGAALSPEALCHVKKCQKSVDCIKRSTWLHDIHPFLKSSWGEGSEITTHIYSFRSEFSWEKGCSFSPFYGRENRGEYTLVRELKAVSPPQFLVQMK